MKKYLFVLPAISALMLSACTAKSANRGPFPQSVISTPPESAGEPADGSDITGADGSDIPTESAGEEPPVDPDAPPDETSDEISVTVDSPMREDPPEITARAGENVVTMARNNYSWTVAVGDEMWDTTACGDTAYSACMNGIAPKLPLDGADTLQIDLPDGAEITSALIYVNDDEGETLDNDGGVITLPALSDGANAFSINIRFPEGECEYVFCGVKE